MHTDASVPVRADTQAFARDIAAMRGELEGVLAQSGVRAAREIGGALSRAAKDGGSDFRDFAQTALTAIRDVTLAIARMRGASAAGDGGGTGGLGGAVGRSGSGGGADGGLFMLLNAGLSLGRSLLGLRAREGGGPVEAGRPYLVGERGPELFVPPGAGRIMRDDEAVGGRGARSIAITVNVKGSAGDGRDRMAMSGRQIARAVRDAVLSIDD